MVRSNVSFDLCGHDGKLTLLVYNDFMIGHMLEQLVKQIHTRAGPALVLLHIGWVHYCIGRSARCFNANVTRRARLRYLN